MSDLAPAATLLTAWQLRGRTARNRVMFGPHETNLGRRRTVSDRHVAYYRRRAAGGAGVIVVETASVHDSDWPYERAPLAGPGASGSAGGWAAVAAACHEEGALALASLGHAGGQGSSAYSQAALWAPSNVPEPAGREVPKAMEDEDVAAVVDGFAAATRLAVAAGLDGVEVNAGQHSLVRQFLSGLTNHRGDGYGEDRLRFAREVLAATRAAAGEAIVGLRLCCDEMAPWAGIVPEQGAEIAAGLAPHVDYIAVVRGSIFTTWATRPDGHTPPGFNLETTRLVRGAVPDGVAVVAQGSIVDADLAERIVADGTADAVEMTRAQIADPDLVDKLSRGEAERIRPCILCNQTCQVRDARNPIVSCVGEPSSGHETEDPPVLSGSIRAPADVLVVGGGPSGLETARVAALAGHRVTVAERAARLGGRLCTAAAGGGRERLALLADWLEAECRRLGVTIACGREIIADDVRAHPGPVVLCTGSRAGRPTYTTEEGADVRTAEQVLSTPRGELPPGPVAVWDPIGGPVGISVAELLAGHGREVALITPDLLVGTELARSGDLAAASTRLLQAGVRLEKRSVLTRVTPGAAEVQDRFTGEPREVKADLLVDAGYRLPDDALWREAPEAPRAGDAVAPRTVYEAVLEGRRAALDLVGTGIS
ncbi:MAG: mycofactocin system FadH/OYE family oxidoreductase 1 [Streptosporangiales bacterium]|nr:mycofactocin system FadH/OYE family oxidoreductase 1 [Streptosporangiales bacterium]